MEVAAPVTRLLFLIADTGGGHRASATAVARALDTLHPGEFAVEVLEPFAFSAPRIAGTVADLYGPLTQFTPAAWGGLYHATNSRIVVEFLRRSVLRTIAPGLRAAVRELDPDAIVSFHPLLNHVANDVLKNAARPRTPLITVITDFVDVHASWICRDVDAVVTPTREGFSQCLRAGMPASRVFSIGLPVESAFTTPPPDAGAKRELRRSLGLAPTRPCVLVCGGADGSGMLVRDATLIARSDLDVELVAVCGRNHRAQARLRGLCHSDGRPAVIQGFVHHMADYMHAADVVVTKAGPSTIAEALCCGLPMLLTWHLPGQERGNVGWVVNQGAGQYVPDVGDLVNILRRLFVPRGSLLDDMRLAAQCAARPHAAEQIGELIARLARDGPGAKALRGRTGELAAAS